MSTETVPAGGAAEQQETDEQRAFEQSLMRIKDDELASVAMDCYPKLDYVDMVLGELDWRIQFCADKDPAAVARLQDTKGYVAIIRQRMAEILSAGNAISRQKILPEAATVIDHDGAEHQFYFSAFELANTGQQTQEAKVRAALKACGFVVSISSKTFINGVGTSRWDTVRETVGHSSTLTQLSMEMIAAAVIARALKPVD